MSRKQDFLHFRNSRWRNIMEDRLTCGLTDDEIKEALKSIDARVDENHPMTASDGIDGFFKTLTAGEKRWDDPEFFQQIRVKG
jgi:hypothetical protein